MGAARTPQNLKSVRNTFMVIVLPWMWPGESSTQPETPRAAPPLVSHSIPRPPSSCCLSMACLPSARLPVLWLALLHSSSGNSLPQESLQFRL